jgi:oligosaccharide repeat unit polymerase
MVQAIPFLSVLLILSAGLVWARSAHRIGFFSPLTFAALAYAVVFGLVPLADIVFAHEATTESGWSPTAWLGVLGSLCLLTGYSIGILVPSRPAEPERPWPKKTALALAGGGVAIGLASAWIYLGGPAGFLHLLQNFADRTTFLRSEPLLTVPATAIAAAAVLLQAAKVYAEPSRLRVLALFVAWIPLTIVVTSFIGQRFHAFAIIIGLLALYSLIRRPIRLAFLAALMALLLAAFIYVGQQRTYVGTTQTAPSLEGKNFYYNYIAGHEVGQFRDFAVAYSEIPDRLPYQYGQTFASLLPGLPVATGGELFTRTFFPVVWADGVSLPAHLPGEFYINFSLPGLILGMILYGLGIGGLERWFRQDRRALSRILIYAYSIPFAALILRGDFTTMAGSYLIGLSFLLSCLWLLRHVRPERRAAPIRG